MHKISLLAAAALVVAAGCLATAAQAKDKPCKAHNSQADCSADKACTWNADKNKCNQAK